MSAAWALARSGADVTVLEREPRVGGLCGTHERDGFRFDLGGHRFLTRSSALLQLVEELLGDELLLRTRSSVVLSGGKKYRYPLELDDVLRQAGAVEGARALLSYLNCLVAPRGPDVSFEDWVTRRFGRRLYDRFFGPYTEKLWGIPPSRISADWAAQRISLLNLSDVFWRLLGLKQGNARTYARRYLYPRLGIGQIFESMAARLRGVLRLGAEVTGLEVRKSRVRAVRFRDALGESELECDAVISTLSLPLLSRMLPNPPASDLRFRAIRLLNVMIDRDEISPHTWMYVSEPRYLMARIQEPKKRSPFAAPEGKTSLMLEVPCTVGDSIWSATDATLYDRCVDDLKHLSIDITKDTIGYFSTWVREGYPIYHLGYEHERNRLLAHVGDYENLISCGRQGAFRYIFMDTAMEMGFAAAEGLRLPELRSEKRLLEVASVYA
jgi:protoporphyrinogen oxidase